MRPLPYTPGHAPRARRSAQEDLWSITAWRGERLTPDLERRLDHLTLTPAMLARVDPAFRPHYVLDRRTLANGARFLQYRTLFGSESRGDRAAIDTPLAKQLSLRSTHLLFRS